MASSAATEFALADGGAGSGGNILYGGAGGADNAIGAGGTGGDGQSSGGGGGGGAGSSGGAGGTGDAGGTGTGGAGGATAGASGVDGSFGGFGGGGGGGGAHGGILSPLPGTALTGGNGGNGGVGGDPLNSMDGDGGGGGAGGYGAVVTGSGNLGILDVNVTGGRGGAGRSAVGVILGYIAGDGGSGGIGLNLTNGLGATFTVNSIVRGGDGGAGAISSDGSRTASGAGGAGIVGSNLNVTVGGSVIGGLSGDGMTRGNAITFTGGTNRLELQGGATITGNVSGASGADTFVLGGTISSTFDIALLDTQYSGFGHYAKTGTNTWTLTGTSAQAGDWTISGGTLRVGSLTNFSPAPFSSGLGLGAITLDGGKLLTTSLGSLANDITFAAGKTSTLAAATGTTLTIGGTDFIGNQPARIIFGANAVAQFGSATDNGVIQIGASSTISLFDIDPTSRMVIAGGTVRDVQDQLFNLTAGVSSITINAGATLDFNDSVQQVLVNLGGAGHVMTGTTGSNTLAIFSTTSSNTFDGVISGAHPVSFNTTGSPATMILTGDNTYTGGTTICFCVTLQLGNGGTTGSIVGDVVNENRLVFNRSNAYTFSGVISDIGEVIQNGTGTLTLTGANTYTGGTLFQRGTLNVGSAGALGTTGTLSFTGGTLQYSAANQTDYSSRFSNAANQAYSIDTNGQNISFASSLVSAGGSLTKLGAGTLTLPAANTLTGATTVNGGTLRGGAANAFSAASATTVKAGGTLDLGGFAQTINAVALAGGTLTNGALTGAITSTGGTINGISGAATLTTTGGTTTITGINTFAGPTTVNGGTLVVDGSLADPAVNAGGTLTGIGSVGDTTVNAGGTFAPGSGAAGTSMTVNGSLALQSGAIYFVQINPATASFATVTGTATLGSATVNANFASGAYIAKKYTILTAGAVQGTFGSLASTGLPANFSNTLSYDATHAYLNLTLNYVPPTVPGYGAGLNTNQQQVADTLVNYFNRTGGIPTVLGALTSSGLTQVSGETATGALQVSFDAMNQFMGVMTDPFTTGRGASAAPNAMGYTEDDALAYAADKRRRSRAEREAFAMFTKAPPKVYEARWNVWAAGFGGSRATDGNGALGSNTTTSSVYGTAVGADYWFSPTTVAGVSMAGGGTNFSVVNGGSGRSDLVQAGAFVRHSEGSAYITAVAAYGWQHITTDRLVVAGVTDRLQAAFNANAYSGRVEAGNRWLLPTLGGIGIAPYAAVQVTAFELPAYAETSANGAATFGLTYAGKTVPNTRTELGLRTDKSFALDDALLTLRGRAAWAHDVNTDRSIAATFQSLPGASFTVNGAPAPRNAALTSASAEIKWSNGWAAAATFDGEFSDTSRSYAGRGVVRYAW